MSEADKRHFHRVGHDARATLSQGKNTWPCVVEDLSLKGCMVKFEAAWPVNPNATYHLDIHLSYAIHIEMDVILAHRLGEHCGFLCTSIDSDSVAQLKRLVELNLGDSSLLERDMQALLTGR